MKDVCVWLVGIVMAVFAFRYAHQVKKHEINPAVSTWIIFLFGTGLSLATYLIAENHDFRSGILNTMDFVAVCLILLSILVWGKRALLFKPFEKYYLGGAVVIVVYEVLSGNEWHSNVFTQILISFGYFPTIQNLIEERRNTESFWTWGLGMLAGILSLYPAIVEGNTLATLYSARTIALVAIIMSFMIHYQRHSKKR